MKISGQKNYLTALESVAMTDIVLNMFIFFFISFSLLYTFNPYRVQKLEIKLPRASNVSAIENLGQVNIVLSNEGVIYFNDEAVNLRVMKEKISARQKQSPNLIVILRADRLVTFTNIVNVLDALTELGVTNLNIAAVKE